MQPFTIIMFHNYEWVEYRTKCVFRSTVMDVRPTGSKAAKNTNGTFRHPAHYKKRFAVIALE